MAAFGRRCTAEAVAVEARPPNQDRDRFRTQNGDEIHPDHGQGSSAALLPGGRVQRFDIAVEIGGGRDIGVRPAVAIAADHAVDVTAPGIAVVFQQPG